MLTFFTIILVIALMVFANAFYVAAEFASISARRTRIAQAADEGNRLAKILLPIMNDRVALDRYIAACQIGITVSSLALGAYGQNSIALFLSPVLFSLGAGILTEAVAFSISATGVLITLTILQVLFGELLPKSFTLQHPEKTAMAVVVPMKWSLAVFRPLIWFFNGSANFLAFRMAGVKQDNQRAYIHSSEEIELLFSESYEGGLLADEAQQMLRNALHLHDLTARQVMVARTRLVAAPLESSVTDLIDLSCASGYSRIPLYKKTIDNIVGFVHLKDLFRLRLQEQQYPGEVLREVLYVPEMLPIANVWATMSKKRKYIVIVFDEYGGTAGLISFEDLIEEIFGELLDEFDNELPLMSSDKKGRIHLRSDLLVTDVNEYLNLDLPDDEADTLGGLVFGELGRLPEVGDEVTVGVTGVTIRVEAVEDRHISEISLKLLTDAMPHISEWNVAYNE